MDYRIDELARAAGTTVRNVRAYQDRELLPPPRRAGRVGWYGEAHLARLRVIGALLERGYSLGNIAELLEAWESGSDLGELLGLEAAMTRPFSDEAPTTMGVDELAKLFAGGAGAVDPRVVETALALGFVRLEGGQVLVESLRLLRAGAELHRAGVPLPELLAELAALRRDVDGIAARFVDLIVTHVLGRYGEAPRGAATKLTDAVRRIRPLAELAVTSELARALDRHIKARVGERLGRLLGKKPRRRRA